MRWFNIAKYHNIVSNRKEIEKLLEKLHSITSENNFDEDCSQLTLINNKKTSNTLLDLDFDSNDIVDVLKSLKLCNYSETLIDKNDDNPPLLYVFGKLIKDKEIYIKFKIRERQKKCIICVSFHYSEHKMHYPYC